MDTTVATSGYSRVHNIGLTTGLLHSTTAMLDDRDTARVLGRDLRKDHLRNHVPVAA
jgi:hypothetical protein